MFLHLITILYFPEYFPLSPLDSKFGGEGEMIFPDFCVSKNINLL